MGIKHFATAALALGLLFTAPLAAMAEPGALTKKQSEALNAYNDAVRNFDHHNESWQTFRGTRPVAGGNLDAVYLTHKSVHSFLPPSHLIGCVLPNFNRNYNKYGNIPKLKREGPLFIDSETPL